MEKIEKGDTVARKSHNKDILFTVERFYTDSNGFKIFILRGLTIRIIADSYEDDLEIINKKIARDSLKSLDIRINNRINKLFNEKINKYNVEKDYSKFKTGKVLHLDGDKFYSEKSAKYYKKIGIDAVVKNISESKQPILVKEYIKKYDPDILILTGHDGMLKKDTKYGDLSNYRNSKYFIQGVLEARKVMPSSNRLAIFAGACQSFFEAIMISGANFASSPGRILIDFMDPLIVAEKIAISDKNKFVTINDIAGELRDGKKSIDGSGVMGKKPM